MSNWRPWPRELGSIEGWYLEGRGRWIDDEENFAFTGPRLSIHSTGVTLFDGGYDDTEYREWPLYRCRDVAQSTAWAHEWMRRGGHEELMALDALAA